MKRISTTIFLEEPQRSIIYLATLILVRAAIQIALFRDGFISVAADEFARGIRAAEWAEHPRINILADVQGIWLPFEKYVNGLFLLLWPNVIVVPRVTVFLASALFLITIYILAYSIFNSFVVAVLSTLFITFLPWYVWLSGTPMLEMYYFAPFFAGLFLIIVWLKEARKGYWFWAGVCFLVASGFHVQSWTFINLVHLLTLPLLYQFARQRDGAKIAKLIAYYVLSNGLIISFSVIEFASSGKVFAFLAHHTTYSKAFYSGYNVSVLEKFLYYPTLVIQQSSAVVWVCLCIALVFLRRDPERQWKMFPLLLALLALLLNSVLNVFSVPATAAPGRYALFYLIILSLYVAYGIYALFLFGWHHARRLVGVPVVTMAVVLFVYGIVWGAARVPNYPQGMPLDAVEVGYTINALLNNHPGTYIVELKYWEFLAVELTAQHYDTIIFDRDQDAVKRDTPSLFSQAPKQICRSLRALENLRYVVLHDEALKAQVQQIAFLKQYQNVGTWTIYEVVSQPECANSH